MKKYIRLNSIIKTVQQGVAIHGLSTGPLTVVCKFKPLHLRFNLQAIIQLPKGEDRATLKNNEVGTIEGGEEEGEREKRLVKANVSAHLHRSLTVSGDE